MKILLLLLLLLLVISLASCKVIQCKSRREVPVTFYVTSTGRYYTIAVPYCDTVAIKTAKDMPNTMKLIKQ